MKTEITETGQLSSQITITLEPEDYRDKLEKELRKYKDKAHIKGFRKGKTPMSAIRKMYGKSILSEIINTELQTGLTDYISTKSLDILGQPLPSEDHPQVDFDLKELGEYAFTFDLGLAPKINVTGLDATSTYDHFKVEVDDSMLDEEMNNLSKRLGTQEETEEPIEEMDILSVYAVEKEGADRDVYTTEFTIMVERMSDEYRDAFLQKKKGYSQEVNVFEFEKDTSEDYVRKYLITEAPEDVNPLFDIEVKEVKRLVPATLDKETLDKAFGPDAVADEAEAREKIRQDIESYFEEQARSVTKRVLMDSLVEKNAIELPDTFLKRWLMTSNPEIDAEQIEGEYEGFTKNLRWTLIKGEMAKKFDIKIEPEDIKKSITAKVRKQFGQYHYEGLNYDELAENLMKKQETVQKEYEELLSEAVLDAALQEVDLHIKSVSIDEFKETVSALQQNFG